MRLIQVTDQRLGDDTKLRRYVETSKECDFCRSAIDYVVFSKRDYVLALCRDCAHIVPARLFAKLGMADPTMVVLGGERALDALRTGMMANFNAALANEMARLLSKGPAALSELQQQPCHCSACQAEAAAKANGQGEPVPNDLHSMLKHMGVVLPKPKGKTNKKPESPAPGDPPFGPTPAL